MMPRQVLRTILFIGLLVLVLPCTVFSEALPRLVDVGADRCIPCIKMAPVLEQLREDLAGKLEVVFIDAWKSREEAASYGVKMIPTQIFYAADGRELFRHTGFYGREEILAKWRELGYPFEKDKP
ncbi:thioredoxin family protein [Desulfuromonas versatilis]|nr:thioredoxin family protein [Desulfuromonas versatilis]